MNSKNQLPALQQAQLDQLRHRLIVLMYRHETDVAPGQARDALEAHALKHYESDHKFRQLINELVEESSHLVKAHPNATADLPIVPARKAAGDSPAASPAEPGGPAGLRTRAHSRLFICPMCLKELWTTKIPTGQVAHCELGHGPMQERFPERVDLTAIDRGLLHWISDTMRMTHGQVLSCGIEKMARNLAADRAANKKTIPQWLADYLQPKPGQSNNPSQP